MPQNQDATLLWTAIGLFMVTTVLSQWVQNRHQKSGQTKRRRRKENTACSIFNNQRNDDESDAEVDDNDDDDEVDDELRQLYRNRRLQDRLSYEDLSKSTPKGLSLSENASLDLATFLPSQEADCEADRAQRPMMTKNMPASKDESSPHMLSWSLGFPDHCRDNTNNNDKSQEPSEPTEWNRHLQQRRSTSQFHRLPLIDSSSSSTTTTLGKHRPFNDLQQQRHLESQHPNAYFDFHPKNRNWQHFEHYNEMDRKRHEEKAEQVAAAATAAASVAATANDKLLAIPTGSPTNDNGPSRSLRPDDKIESNVTNGNDNNNVDDDDDAESISSSSASSAEEQFVWTKHRHRSATNEPKFGAGSDNKDNETNEKTMKSQTEVPQKRSSSFSVSSSSRGTFGSMGPLHLVQRMLSMGSGEDYLRKKSETQAMTTIRTSSMGVHSRKLRAEYNARIMPEKVILVRHGQSMGNIDEVLYSTTPDNAMPLTDLGWEQARAAGKILKEKILAKGGTVHFIVSPYVRTVETFHGIASAWCDPDDDCFTGIESHDGKVKAWYERLMEQGLTWNEDSRLREQDFGNYQNPEVIKRAKEERQRFGAFYYRFPNGESASDVFDRVSTFLDSLWRSFEMNKSQNYVLVTHGIVLRVLLTRYFRYTIDQFNILANPRNCETVILGHAGEGKLDMEGRCALELEQDPETHETHVKGYKFHKRLRILPRNYIRKVKARISASEK